jgi:ankyrin repeat protein
MSAEIIVCIDEGRKKERKKERMNCVDQKLIQAAMENSLPEVGRLLSVGADVNATNSGGWTPLIVASMMGHVQVVNELMEHGADIEVKTNYGWTPLHLACRQDHLAIVKALVSGGADILAANNHRELPFHLAVSERQSAVAKYLLQIFYATICGCLPLHELLDDLTWNGDPEISDVPPLRAALDENVLDTDDVVEILEYLVDRNPELISSCDRDGSLPLHVACRRGASFSVVQFLVNRYKASIKSVTSEGDDLPLFLACEMPDSSLDTIFILMKLYPDLVYR